MYKYSETRVKCILFLLVSLIFKCNVEDMPDVFTINIIVAINPIYKQTLENKYIYYKAHITYK